jgi:hypothetical protein
MVGCSWNKIQSSRALPEAVLEEAVLGTEDIDGVVLVAVRQ